MEQQKSLVVITWDGISSPLSCILKDTIPNFDILIYDYSGIAKQPLIEKITTNHFISIKSECKGDILQNTYRYLSKIENIPYKYIGILDDDIYFSITDLNKLLFIAELEKLDVFQASLSHDSYYNHRNFIHKPGYQILKAWWVEIMSPFYSFEIFMEAGQYFDKSISGTGIDVYLIPTIQQLLDKTNTAVIHAVQMKHCRSIRTDGRVFSNGKTNLQEIQELNIFCRDMITTKKIDVDKDFIENVLNKKYVYGIPLRDKIKRIMPMIKNLYRLIVDASYR